MDVAKKRASLRGRGTEILMGVRQVEPAETEVDAESLEKTRAVDEPPESVGVELELAPEWADLLQEEARSASGSVSTWSAETEPNAVLSSLPLLATMPARPAKSTRAAARGQEKLASGSSQTSETAQTAQAQEVEPGAAAWPAPADSESQGVDSAGGAFVPAPKEKPEATDTVIRARLNGLLYQEAAVRPSDKAREADRPESSEVLAFVGEKPRKALWEETLELYLVVPDVLANDAGQAGALRLLQEAQTILLENPRQFDVARYKVSQVRALVSQRHNVNRWSKTYGWGIFLYEMVWMVALLVGLFGARTVVSALWGLVGGSGSADAVLGLWNTMMWGAMGGMVGALYTLHWHVARLADFDKHYTMWYVAQPMIALLWGLLVHLLIGPGFITGLDMTGAGREVRNTLFPYAVACIGGFRLQSLLELVDRGVQAILGLSQHKTAPVKETSTKELLDSSA